MGDNSYKPYLIPGKDTATDQNVGLISRIDPESALFRDEQRATVYRSESTCGSLQFPDYESGVSKHFIARFNVAQIGRISLIGAHLLAFPVDPERCVKREAQAIVLKNIAQNEMNQGRQVIVLGDLNDYDRDVLDASNSIPTSRVSRLLKYNDQGSKIMYNVAELISQRSDRYSSWWDKNSNCRVEAGELTLIDHVLVTSQLHQLISSVRIYNIVELCGSLQSDHYPIKVVFDPTIIAAQETALFETSATQQDDTSGDAKQQAIDTDWRVPASIIGIVGVLFGGVVVAIYVRYGAGTNQERQQLL